MSSTFSKDSLAKLQNVDTNSVLRMYKLKLMLIYMGTKTINPNCTQKNTAKEIVRFDSTIKRYPSDQNIDNLYNRNKKSAKKIPTILTDLD